MIKQQARPMSSYDSSPTDTMGTTHQTDIEAGRMAVNLHMIGEVSGYHDQDQESKPTPPQRNHIANSRRGESKVLTAHVFPEGPTGRDSSYRRPRSKKHIAHLSTGKLTPSQSQTKTQATKFLSRLSSFSGHNGLASSSTNEGPMTGVDQSRCGCHNVRKTRVSRTLLPRILFVGSLLVTIVLCASVAWTVISDLEMEIGRQTYESVAESALDAAKDITMQKVKGGDAMGSVISNAFPDADMWPMVGLDGYHETANTIASLSGGTSMAFMVLVEPDEVEEFETSAQMHYRAQGYPQDAGATPEIGFGIRVRDSSAEGGYGLDHEGNYTTYNSTNKVLVPVLDHSTLGSPMLLYNVHVSSTAVDGIINCSNEHARRHTHDSEPHCSVVTGFKVKADGDLVALIYKPIYPRSDPTKLVGIIGLSVNFKDVLVSVVPRYFDGVVAVISTHTPTAEEDHTTIAYDTVTYNIVEGYPQLVGEGDLHDPNYDTYARSIVLNDLNSDASDAVIYTLTLYPSSFNQYRTNIPMAVSLSFVGVILISTFIFFLYDSLIRHESSQAKLVLDMKRRFVRFISHEIRTPLNTVSMGLELLEQEIRSHLPGPKLEDLFSSSSNTSNVDVDNIHATQTNSAWNTSDGRVDQKCVKTWVEITNDIQENVPSAVNILDDLLNYDKVESGTLQLEIGTVSIVDLVGKAVRKFQVQATKHDIDLKLNIASNPSSEEVNATAPNGNKTTRLDDAMVVGDEMRLTQVICNLISNSLKFTPTKGTIEVSLKHLAPTRSSLSGPKSSSSDRHSDSSTLCDRPWAGSVVISVRDTGAGMTEDQISRLFSEGVQFDANKLQAGGGSGLGLCISKGIVDRHNGIITAESEGRDKGTTFWVELPLYDFGEDDDTMPASFLREGLGISIPEETYDECQSEASTPKGNGSSEGTTNDAMAALSNASHHHILVVEDVASSRKMLIRLLERAGHTCVPAVDGLEAIDAVLATTSAHESCDLEQGNRRPFDTILMDYEMPRLDGPSATEKLRTLGFEDLIIGVTGNVLSEDVAFFVSKGANCVLPKPVSMQLLNDAWNDPRHRKQRRKKRAMLTKLSSSCISLESEADNCLGLHVEDQIPVDGVSRDYGRSESCVSC